MTITIKTKGLEEVEQLLLIFKSLNIEMINVESSPTLSSTNISKGDKSINPTELFGIWKDNPKTIEEIRSKDWKRNWNI